MADLKMKVVEIRDQGTCIAALAMQMKSTEQTLVSPLAYWLRRCGYPSDGSSIMLMMLSDGKATNDPYEWTALRMGPRTMPVAHDWIIDRWEHISDGDVIDVQVILGETSEVKVSERLTASL